ncbi:MAG: RidA family protein [Pseudomonadota bacterium]
MDRYAVVPPDMAALYTEWQMAPGLATGGFLFLTGMTGVGADGRLSPDPETQIRAAFDAVGAVLREAGLGFGDMVEMTSYHIGLRDHLALFRQVRTEHIAEPWPAWTAVEVAGFVSQGVIVELRVIARMRPPGP